MASYLIDTAKTGQPNAKAAPTPTPLAMRRAMSLPKLKHGAVFSLYGQPQLVFEFREEASANDDFDGRLYAYDKTDINADNPIQSMPVDMLTPSSLRVHGAMHNTDTWYFADMAFLGYIYHIHDLCGEPVNKMVTYDDVDFLCNMAVTTNEDYRYIRVATLAPNSRFPAALNLRDTLTPEVLEELLRPEDTELR